MNEIARRLSALIQESGMTYRDLSDMTGIPKSAIQRYATGGTEKIPVDRIIKLSGALGTTPEALLGWESEIKTHPQLSERVLRRLREDPEFREVFDFLLNVDPGMLSAIKKLAQGLARRKQDS